MKCNGSYSIEGDYRERASKWIAVISVILFFVVDEYFMSQVVAVFSCIVVASQSLSVIAEIVVSAVSAFLIYSVLWWWFDLRLWRCSPFTRWHHIRNLNGVWKGKGISSFKNDEGAHLEYPFELSIRQTFTQMTCRVQTAHSISNATLVGLRCINDLEPLCFLEMVFSNRTKSEESAKNDRWPDVHEGFCRYSVMQDEMNGNYFTNSNPQTKGRIVLHRVEEHSDARGTWRSQ